MSLTTQIVFNAKKIRITSLPIFIKNRIHKRY